MFRKAGIGFAALAMMAPGIASALGVGDYELNSYLNQPLQMEVALTDIGDLSPEEVLVSLASQKEFDAAGVDRAYFLSDLNFEIELAADGSGRVVISSTQPVREPFLNFLVEVVWPTGRLLREYTVLLDPPTYDSGSDSVATAEVSMPAAEPVAIESAPASTVEMAPAEPAAAPVASSSYAPEEEAAPAVASSQPSAAYAGPREEYVVQSQDTMWSIALNARPARSVSVQQMLVAIQELNPNAFIDGNVNLVREGQVLRLPTEEEVRRISTRDALDEIADQNREWKAKLEARGIVVPSRAQVDGTRREGKSDGAEGKAPESGKVTLLAGDDAKGGESAAGESSRGSAELENELAIRDENIDSLKRENADLSSRVDDLKSQVSTSEELLELRNNQIAQLQEQLRKLQEQGAAAPTDAAPVAEVVEAEPEAAVAEPEVVAEGEKAVEGEAAAGTVTEGAEAGAATEVAVGEAGVEGQTEGEVAAVEGEAVAEAAAEPKAEEKKPKVKPEPVKPKVKPQPEPQPEPGIVDLLMENLVFILGGVGLLVLVGVLVVVRNRQKGGADDVDDLEFDDTAGDDDFFVDEIREEGDEDGFGELEEPSDEAAAMPAQDPLEEVDVYTAYGRHAEAVTYLQNEISKAPGRADLKIRLLEVLQEMNDTDGFDQAAAQYGGDPAVAEFVGGSAGAGADEDMSLDDLEMDFSGDFNPAPAAAAPAAEEEDFSLDFGSTESEELSMEAPADLEEDLGDFELALDDNGEDEISLESAAPAAAEEEFSLDFDMGGETPAAEEEDEFSLSLDDDGDDLSAELESAMGIEPALSLGGDSDDLELDLGDDDIQLADVSSEFNEAAQQPSSEEIDLSLDDLDSALDLDADTPTEVGLAAVSDDDLDAFLDEPAPATEQRAPVEQAPTDMRPAVSADNLDDDDFDFLGDTDENATKLDLAKAYIDMGDSEGARDILNEVVSEGSPQQQQEAKDLLAQVG